MRKKYEKMMLEAVQLQRNGKIPEFAAKTAEAEALMTEIKELESQA